MIKKIIICLILIPLISSCGFKIVNEGGLRNFEITSIDISGDPRIKFSLKNKLKSIGNSGNRQVKLNINAQKSKNIKEKNIKNEVTKYELIINVETEYEIENEKRVGKFTITKSGDYNLKSQYSQTLNNEKDLIKLLIDDVAKEINSNLTILINDL